ncbi:MAG: ABC transporter permease [Erysipelotrichales bacterium]
MFLYIIKLALRKLKEYFKQFCSIILISCTGVAIYTGINSVEGAMKVNADNYFKEQNVSSISLFNPYGISKEEYNKVNDILKSSSLKDFSLEYSSSLDGILKYNKEESIIKLNSIETMNSPKIREGRMPNNDAECVVDIDNTWKLNNKVNIEVNGKKKDCSIVGKAYFAQYFNSMQKGYNLSDSSEIKNIVYAPSKFVSYYTKHVPNKYNTLYISTSLKNIFSDEYKASMNNLVKKLEKGLDNNKFFITSFDKDPSIKTYDNDSSQIKEIALIFPVIFFLVSALVGSSIMSRMLDDERIQIGTLLALGYKRTSIIFIYFVFAFFSTLLGWLLGCVIGISIIPGAVIDAYSSLYQLPNFEIILNYGVIFSALAFSMLTVVGTTLIVSFKQTGYTCATLMRPKSPRAGKEIFLERVKVIWNKFSFINKVSIRNIFRYKKRLLMSVVAIMGCSGLLMIGLGIESSISPISELQYDSVYKYNYSAYTDNLSNKDMDLIKNKVDGIEGIDDSIPVYRKNVELVKSDIEDNLNIVVPLSNKDLNKYISFNDSKFSDNSIFITKKIASSHKIKEGDNIEVKVDNKIVDFKVDSIVDNYVDNYIYVNKEGYQDKVGNITYNNILIKGSTKESTLKSLENLNELNIILSNDKLKDTMAKSMGGLDNIVYIMVIFAGLLVIVVMYTLTNLNLRERHRELATLKVLGYYDKEISKYIFKENIILTIFGLFFGLFFGTFLHAYIITKAEMPNIYFLKSLPLNNYLLTILFTLIFTLSVNLIMSRNIKKIDMVESLKSIE